VQASLALLLLAAVLNVKANNFFSAKASSQYASDYGPLTAIDDKISQEHRHFFHSQAESNPWLELSMPEGYISGVEIVTRYGCCPDRVRDIEVRAGMDSVPNGFKGELTINTKVATFVGPADANLKTYRINFDRSVLAKYVTLQRIGGHVTLEINEVTMIKSPPVHCNLCLNEEDSNHVRSVVTKFMNKFDVAGSSFALVKNGRLVFAEGFGVMDKVTQEPVQATSLFRIASLSKPLTAATLMMMIEKKPALLKATIFGEKGLLGTKYGTKPYSSYEKQITLQHLLEHTAGGLAWTNKPNDPMFDKQHLWDDFTQLIGWVLDSRDPEVQPGTKYAYSNFGYCVLGRIIEVLSGQDYETYVKNAVLTPVGANDMKIARNSRSDKFENEVTYYANFDPYSMNVERMDAHGGWVASAVDFANFLMLFDRFQPDMITRATFDLMVTPSSVHEYYAKGWSVNPRHQNIWHTGSLPGTGAFAMNAANGISAVFLMNYRWKNEVDPMVWEAIGGIKNW